jgi:hypothetical protein
MDVPTPNLPGRALTPEQKRAIIERVLVAWEANPQLRLGQLIVNTLGRNPAHPVSLFFVEDEEIAELLEKGR